MFCEGLCFANAIPTAHSQRVPRYFFHTQTETRSSDATGIEMRSHTEARAEAIRTCGEMMRDNPEAFWGSRPWNVTVTDASGLVLYEIMMDGTASPAAAR